MPNLKDLRIRIASVKSTQKITSAMKMVAAAKLRRAQEAAEASRPYAERMERMLGSLAASTAGHDGAPRLLAGTGGDQTNLLVVGTADRGLCGGFNSNIVREVRRKITALQGAGKTVKILCVGRKGRDQLRREHGTLIIDTIEEITRPRLTFEGAESVAKRVERMFEDGEFDVCTIFYARFKSAMTQIVTAQQLIPFTPPESGDAESEETGPGKAVYEYEPSEEEILAELLPRNLAVQIFKALLENNASEQGARMTAMDNATRNAGEMIDKLTLTYNRTRQAVITNELIEIISGAEAL
ncbi:MAG: F0F1 ATP synthase subunit gamma [Kiloniellales bacterium]|jgi:F-type H+-transporting ATPase subunit gamma